MAKKINFSVQVKDVFGEIVKEFEGTKKERPLNLAQVVVSVISHPKAIKDGNELSPMDIVTRLTLQQKVAQDAENEYSTDELAIIRESAINVFNAKCSNVTICGMILKLTE